MKPILPIAAACALTWACAPWQPVTGVPSTAVAFDSTKTYRVTLRSGEREVAYHPRVSADSLTWVEPVAPDRPRMPPKHSALALSEIQLVEVQGSDVAGAAVAVWLGVGALVAVVSFGGRD